MSERNRYTYKPGMLALTERSSFLLNSQKNYYRQYPVWTSCATQRDKNKNEGGQKK